MNAIILAGGKNSRIGTRKALLEVEGKSIIQRTIETLKPHFDRLLLVTNEPEVYEIFGLPMVSDEIPEQGPLSGIHAGLAAVESEYSFVIACDMPFLDSRLIRCLKTRAEELKLQAKSQGVSPPSCVVPSWQKGIEPLHAFYHKGLRTKIPTALAEGERSLRRLVRRWDGAFIDLDNWALQEGVDLYKVFSNVNTWEEFTKASQLTQEGRN